MVWRPETGGSTKLFVIFTEVDSLAEAPTSPRGRDKTYMQNVSKLRVAEWLSGDLARAIPDDPP